MAEALEDFTETQTENQLYDEPEDPNIPWWRRVTFFLRTYWRGLICLFTPLILILVLTPFPPEKHQWCAYTLLIMATFWVTECIPLPITSFFPIVIFPLVGVMDTRTACQCYMNDTVLMFYGSMVLAYAIEQSGLHQRLALFAIRIIGYSHYRLLFAMSLTTMFFSMWITNTAATTMMVPIIFAVLRIFENQNLITIYEKDSNGDMIASDITTCYFCAASFSATVGGIGTLVGSATNLVFKGLFQRTYPMAPEYLSFPKFSAFTIPYMVLLEAGIYFYLIVVYLGFLRPKSPAAQNAEMSEQGVLAAKDVVEKNFKRIGKITFWEIMVIILFSGAMLLFFCRSPQIFYGWGDSISDYFTLNDYKFVRDSAAAFLVCSLMLLLPSTLDIFLNCSANIDDLPDKPVPSVLNWILMNERMPYSFMFLLGGGFALSEAAKKEYSDLNGKIGTLLRNLNIFPNYFIILLVIIFTVFMTNFASNVAVCNVITPIVMQLVRTSFYEALTKTGLDDSVFDSEVFPREYTVLRCDRVGRSGGGVLLAARALLTHTFGLRLLMRSMDADPLILVTFKKLKFVALWLGFLLNLLKAVEINIHPLWYNIASGISASFCFCLPVGTPGNLVIQSAANIPTMKMVKAGVGPTVITVLISLISISFWAPVIWPDLEKQTAELTWIE